MRQTWSSCSGGAHGRLGAICAGVGGALCRRSSTMNEGVPPPSSRASPLMVVHSPDGTIAWTCIEAGPLGLDFGLAELDEGMIGLEVKAVAPSSMASLVPGLRPTMILQQIDEFHIREPDSQTPRLPRQRLARI